MTPALAKFLLVQSISLGGVLVLVALAWLLGFRLRVRVLDEHHVIHLAGQDHLAAPADIAVDMLGRTAIAQIDSENVYVVKAVGDRFTTRVFPRSAIAGIRMYRPKGKGIGARLRFSDAGFDTFAIEFAGREAPPYIERLRRGARAS